MNVVPPAAPATDVAVCAQGQPVADLFTDDLEVTNDGRWTYQQSPGAFRWGYQSESQFSYATSGDQGFYGPTTGATADRSVVMSAAVDLPRNRTRSSTSVTPTDSSRAAGRTGMAAWSSTRPPGSAARGSISGR